MIQVEIRVGSILESKETLLKDSEETQTMRSYFYKKAKTQQRDPDSVLKETQTLRREPGSTKRPRLCKMTQTLQRDPDTAK